MIKLKYAEWDIIADWVNTAHTHNCFITGANLKSYIETHRLETIKTSERNIKDTKDKLLKWGAEQ